MAHRRKFNYKDNIEFYQLYKITIDIFCKLKETIMILKYVYHMISRLFVLLVLIIKNESTSYNYLLVLLDGREHETIPKPNIKIDVINGNFNAFERFKTS